MMGINSNPDFEIYKGKCENGEIEITHTDPVFHNEYSDVVNDHVRFPSGFEGTYLRISFPTAGSIAVLPVTKDGKIVLIRTFRHGVRSWGYEVPKGGISLEENAEEAAIRELQEETGYECTKIKKLETYADSPAVCQSMLCCYIAEGCRPGIQQKKEKTEAISNVIEVTPDEYFKLMDDCKDTEHFFRDAVTELLICRFACFGR